MFLIFIYSKVLVLQGKKPYVVIWGRLVYFATCVIGPLVCIFPQFYVYVS